jgi:hypothetical protein
VAGGVFGVVVVVAEVAVVTAVVAVVSVVAATPFAAMPFATPLPGDIRVVVAKEQLHM